MGLCGNPMTFGRSECNSCPDYGSCMFKMEDAFKGKKQTSCLGRYPEGDKPCSGCPELAECIHMYIESIPTDELESDLRMRGYSKMVISDISTDDLKAELQRRNTIGNKEIADQYANSINQHIKRINEMGFNVTGVNGSNQRMHITGVITDTLR